jgi:hypothetical protein
MKAAVFSMCMLAAAPALADPPARDNTVVRSVTVAAGPGPKVVASYPAEGASVPGGVLVLKIVFDQAMTPKQWAYGPAEIGAFPNCLAQPRLLADQHTFALLCTVAANADYAISVNPAPTFQSADGVPAKAFVLHFKTGDVGVRQAHAALVQAGLTDDDMPMMSWDDPGKGVSQSDPPSP